MKGSTELKSIKEVLLREITTEHVAQTVNGTTYTYDISKNNNTSLSITYTRHSHRLTTISLSLFGVLYKTAQCDTEHPTPETQDLMDIYNFAKLKYQHQNSK